jgi:hypothetical protein
MKWIFKAKNIIFHMSSNIHSSGEYSPISKFFSSINVGLAKKFHIYGMASHPKFTKNESHPRAHRHRIYAIESVRVGLLLHQKIDMLVPDTTTQLIVHKRWLIPCHESRGEH